MSKSVMSDAEYQATNKLGKGAIEEMKAMKPEALKKLVVDSSERMKKIKDELDANPKYQQVKADKSNLESGKRDVDNREKARIRLSLEMISNIEKLSPQEAILWSAEREILEAKLKSKKETK